MTSSDQVPDTPSDAGSESSWDPISPLGFDMDAPEQDIDDRSSTIEAEVAATSSGALDLRFGDDDNYSPKSCVFDTISASEDEGVEFRTLSPSSSKSVHPIDVASRRVIKGKQNGTGDVPWEISDDEAEEEERASDQRLREHLRHIERVQDAKAERPVKPVEYSLHTSEEKGGDTRSTRFEGRLRTSKEMEGALTSLNDAKQQAMRKQNRLRMAERKQSARQKVDEDMDEVDWMVPKSRKFARFQSRGPSSVTPSFKGITASAIESPPLKTSSEEELDYPGPECAKQSQAFKGFQSIPRGPIINSNERNNITESSSKPDCSMEFDLKMSDTPAEPSAPFTPLIVGDAAVSTHYNKQLKDLDMENGRTQTIPGKGEEMATSKYDSTPPMWHGQCDNELFALLFQIPIPGTLQSIYMNSEEIKDTLPDVALRRRLMLQQILDGPNADILQTSGSASIPSADNKKPMKDINAFSTIFTNNDTTTPTPPLTVPSVKSDVAHPRVMGPYPGNRKRPSHTGPHGPAPKRPNIRPDSPEYEEWDTLSGPMINNEQTSINPVSSGSSKSRTCPIDSNLNQDSCYQQGNGGPGDFNMDNTIPPQTMTAEEEEAKKSLAHARTEYANAFRKLAETSEIQKARFQTGCNPPLVPRLPQNDTWAPNSFQFSTASSSSSIQDPQSVEVDSAKQARLENYNLQLSLLEQQNKKRLAMARCESRQMSNDTLQDFPILQNSQLQPLHMNHLNRLMPLGALPGKQLMVSSGSFDAPSSYTEPHRITQSEHVRDHQYEERVRMAQEGAKKFPRSGQFTAPLKPSGHIHGEAGTVYIGPILTSSVQQPLQHQNSTAENSNGQNSLDNQSHKSLTAQGLDTPMESAHFVPMSKLPSVYGMQDDDRTQLRSMLFEQQNGRSVLAQGQVGKFTSEHLAEGVLDLAKPLSFANPWTIKAQDELPGSYRKETTAREGETGGTLPENLGRPTIFQAATRPVKKASGITPLYPLSRGEEQKTHNPQKDQLQSCGGSGKVIADNTTPRIAASETSNSSQIKESIDPGLPLFQHRGFGHTQGVGQTQGLNKFATSSAIDQTSACPISPPGFIKASALILHAVEHHAQAHPQPGVNLKDVLNNTTSPLLGTSRPEHEQQGETRRQEQREKQNPEPETLVHKSLKLGNPQSSMQSKGVRLPPAQIQNIADAGSLLSPPEKSSWYVTLQNISHETTRQDILNQIQIIRPGIDIGCILPSCPGPWGTVSLRSKSESDADIVAQSLNGKVVNGNILLAFRSGPVPIAFRNPPPPIRTITPWRIIIIDIAPDTTEKDLRECVSISSNCERDILACSFDLDPAGSAKLTVKSEEASGKIIQALNGKVVKGSTLHASAIVTLEGFHPPTPAPNRNRKLPPLPTRNPSSSYLPPPPPLGCGMRPPPTPSKSNPVSPPLHSGERQLPIFPPPPSLKACMPLAPGSIYRPTSSGHENPSSSAQRVLQSSQSLPAGIWIQTITNSEGQTQTRTQMDRPFVKSENVVEVTTTTVKEGDKITTITKTAIFPMQARLAPEVDGNKKNKEAEKEILDDVGSSAGSDDLYD